LAITAFLATLASNVIYGLRRRVSEIARVGQYVLREKLREGGWASCTARLSTLASRDRREASLADTHQRGERRALRT
jgi:hypothetical protein